MWVGGSQRAGDCGVETCWLSWEEGAGWLGYRYFTLGLRFLYMFIAFLWWMLGTTALMVGTATVLALLFFSDQINATADEDDGGIAASDAALLDGPGCRRVQVAPERTVGS